MRYEYPKIKKKYVKRKRLKLYTFYSDKNSLIPSAEIILKPNKHKDILM